MRILLFVDSLHGGGAESMARTWVDALRSDGHEVYVSTFVGATELREGDERFVPSRRLARWVLLPLWFRGVVRRRRPDVVLSLLTFTNLVALVATRGLRKRPTVVISERSFPSVYLRKGKLGWKLQARAARLMYAHADGVVALSHPVAGDLVSWFRVPVGRVTVVPNPVLRGNGAIAGQHVVAPARGTADLRILFVGRLVDHKRVDLAVRAVAELGARGQPASLRVFGVGPLLAPLQALAKELRVDVVWEGWEDDWTTALTHASCLILPSRVEGFGNVLVEASRQGVPVVSLSSAMGVADAIIPGVTGVLAYDDSPSALANAIEQASELIVPIEALSGWWDHFSVANSTMLLVKALQRAMNDGGAP